MRKTTLVGLFIIAFAAGLSPVLSYAQPVCAYPAQWVWRGYWSCEYPGPEYYPPPDYYPYYDYPYFDYPYYSFPYYWGPYLDYGGSVGRVYPRGGGHAGGGPAGGGVRGGGGAGGHGGGGGGGGGGHR